MKAFACAALAAVALIALPDLAASERAQPAFGRGPSTVCMLAHGARTAKVRRTDANRSALSDFAQHTSLEVRAEAASVLVAFERGQAEARLLRELLAVPSNTYKVEIRRNVVLMFLRRDRQLAALVTGCLRA